MRPQSQLKPIRPLLTALPLALLCLIAGCSGPEKMVGTPGNVTFARPTWELLTLAIIGFGSFGIAILLLWLSSGQRFLAAQQKHILVPAVIGLIVCSYIAATLPAQAAARVSIGKSSIEWTVMSFLTWKRHQIQWNDVEQISVHERPGEKLYSNERGTPSKRTSVRFTFKNGRTDEWDVYMDFWGDALREVYANAEQRNIPVKWHRID